MTSRVSRKSRATAAAKMYVKDNSSGRESIDFAHAIRIEALRRLGEILKNESSRPESAAERLLSAVRVTPRRRRRVTRGPHDLPPSVASSACMRPSGLGPLIVAASSNVGPTARVEVEGAGRGGGFLDSRKGGRESCRDGPRSSSFHGKLELVLRPHGHQDMTESLPAFLCGAF